MVTEDFEQAQYLSSQVEQARQRAVLAASDSGAARDDARSAEQQARDYARGVGQIVAGVEAARDDARAAADRAEAPTDSAMANLAKNPYSQFGTALDGVLVKSMPPVIQDVMGPAVGGLVAQAIAADSTVANAAAQAVNANPKIVSLEEKNVAQDTAIRETIAFADPAVPKVAPAIFDLNTAVETTELLVMTTSTVSNAPENSVGRLSVTQENNVVNHWWRSFNAGSLGAFQFTRARSASGVWSSWRPVGIGRPVAAGVNLDTVASPGNYPTLGSNPNSPFPLVGNLSVDAAGPNGLIQTFKTAGEAIPRTAQRRSGDGGKTWGEWSEQASADALNKVASKTIALPSRSMVPAPASVKSSFSNGVVRALSRDRLTGWAVGGAGIRETVDEGLTWTNLSDKDGVNPWAGTTIETVAQMENGELLVTGLVTAEDRRAVWVTSGYGTPAMTATRTMTAREKGIRFPAEWSQSTDGRVIVLGEYGPKVPTWEGLQVTADTAARYVWISLDYGQTWTQTFDLITFITAQVGTNYSYEMHVHGVLWDPYWDRIWVTYGDSRDGVVYSDDLGQSWKTAFFSTTATTNTQMVGMLALPNCVLLASDNATTAHIRRIDRSQGKIRAGNYILTTAWSDPQAGLFCRGLTRAIRRADDAPAVFSFSPDTQAGKSFAVATLDGISFTEIWRDAEPTAAGYGARSIVGPTLRGNFIITEARSVEIGWEQVTTQAAGY